MKKMRCLAAILCVAVPAALFAAPPEGQAVPPEISRAFAKAQVQVLDTSFPISDFSLPLLGGKTQTLSALKGKIVFLNFWATWCPPCRAEMPDMEKLYQRFKNEGLEFLTVNIREDEEAVKTFMNEFKLTFPVVLDYNGDAATKYGIRGIPTTYIIGRDGRIIAAAVGGRQWYSQEMLNAFRALLANGR
ncbi:MAG: TlpA family protein disulfide reductase [Spirochaetia bacterium]|jgi:thiol-disulfide isomerase/thioredoxin|nr:TlpA family protein disulfide reductase [Spirochaetia bacterium]